MKGDIKNKQSDRKVSTAWMDREQRCQKNEGNFIYMYMNTHARIHMHTQYYTKYFKSYREIKQ